MATTTAKKTTSTAKKSAPTTKKAKPIEEKVESVDNVDVTPVKEAPAKEGVKPVEEKPIVPKDIDINQYVTVINGVNGRLVYVSKKTGEKFKWYGFGSEQDMELRELRDAKNTSKSFFVNNKFMFRDEDAWVIDYLGVGQYYKHSIPIDHFDEIFDMTADEIGERVSKLSEGQKRTVRYRAADLIKEGKIDSRKKITVLEEALGVELIEK